MKLVFREHPFSSLRSYRVYDENERLAFVVKNKPALGRFLRICDTDGREVARLKEHAFTYPAEFEMHLNDRYVGERYLGHVTLEEDFCYRSYAISCNGWRIETEVESGGQTIVAPNGKVVAFIEWGQPIFGRYTVTVLNEDDVPTVLMYALTVAIMHRRWRQNRRWYRRYYW